MRFIPLGIAVVTLASSAAIAHQPQTRPATKPIRPVAVTNVEGTYVTVSAGLSAASVTPGGRMTLILDITPHTAIHLYAPGQEGYLPVALTLEKSTSYQAAPVVYPPSDPVFFPELAQTLKLFDGPFRLTRALTMRMDARGAIRVAGTLDYQACDDHVCYKPEKVALRWTVTVSGSRP
jgi:hypothetical protein